MTYIRASDLLLTLHARKTCWWNQILVCTSIVTFAFKLDDVRILYLIWLLFALMLVVIWDRSARRKLGTDQIVENTCFTLWHRRGMPVKVMIKCFIRSSILTEIYFLLSKEHCVSWVVFNVLMMCATPVPQGEWDQMQAATWRDANGNTDKLKKGKFHLTLKKRFFFICKRRPQTAIKIIDLEADIFEMIFCYIETCTHMQISCCELH